MVYLWLVTFCVPRTLQARDLFREILTVAGKTAQATRTCHGTFPEARSTCLRGPMRLLLRPIALVGVTGNQVAVVLLAWRLDER
jgi:hypothetical protein